MSELAGTLETVGQLVQHNFGRKRRPRARGVGAERRPGSAPRRPARALLRPSPASRGRRRETPPLRQQTPATRGERTPVPGETEPGPTATCGGSPAAEVRSGTMWQKGPAAHNGRERAELVAEKRGALGSPEQPAGPRAAAGTRSSHRDTATPLRETGSLRAPRRTRVGAVTHPRTWN